VLIDLGLQKTTVIFAWQMKPNRFAEDSLVIGLAEETSNVILAKNQWF
jgi:hypothetical protein